MKKQVLLSLVVLFALALASCAPAAAPAEEAPAAEAPAAEAPAAEAPREHLRCQLKLRSQPFPALWSCSDFRNFHHQWF